jgi:two-component system, OmpR family, alkaline phosphatase synthesis response regulator PhoP
MVQTKNKGKILIVDDEAHIRLLIAQSLEELEDNGVSILIAEDGDEAVDIVQKEHPNLVFLDVMMPRLNGFDTCEKIKNTLGLTEVKIVLLTAKGQEFDRERGKEVGADLFMTKPFDPDELLAIAEKIIG